MPIVLRRPSSSSRTLPLLWKRDEWKTALTSFLVVFTFVIGIKLFRLVLSLLFLAALNMMIYPHNMTMRGNANETETKNRV
jgi:hypothetical protein